MKRLGILAGLVLSCVCAGSVGARSAVPHSVVLFIPDGLRALMVTRETAPAMAALRDAGVFFKNSHSLFPTFTTPNASAMATGHYLGDTGDFSNAIYSTFTTGCDQPLLCTVEVADTGLQQGQGMHGTFSRADTMNFMAAIGPDFKRSFVDEAPVSNADVGVTIARILLLPLPANGKLVGRLIKEAMPGGKQPPYVAKTICSEPSESGLRTVLDYQMVGATRYFDAAGFPGRTVGLADAGARVASAPARVLVSGSK